MAERENAERGESCARRARMKNSWWMVAKAGNRVAKTLNDKSDAQNHRKAQQEGLASLNT